MMPDGPIHIATQDNATTTLKAAGSARRYTLRGMPGDDFPPLPRRPKGRPRWRSTSRSCSELIAKTHFSISTDETRAHLNSALFEWDGDIVRMVTTDGHRLSKMEVKVTGRQASATMLIPLKAIQELRRLCDEMLASDADKRPARRRSRSSRSRRAARARSSRAAGMTFSVKLVDAQFPPYSQVIPQSSDKTSASPRAAFADALRAVSIAASERTGGVKLTITKGTMRITSESPESGDGFDEVPVDYAGAEHDASASTRSTSSTCSAALDEDEVVLGLSGELDPAVCRPGERRGSSSPS